jgi:hypothetical protein
LQQVFDEADPAHIATLLRELRNAPNGAERRTAGFVRRHSAGKVFFDLLAEMELHFRLKLMFHRAAAENGAEAQPEFVERSHFKPLGQRDSLP